MWRSSDAYRYEDILYLVEYRLDTDYSITEWNLEDSYRTLDEAIKEARKLDGKDFDNGSQVLATRVRRVEL